MSTGKDKTVEDARINAGVNQRCSNQDDDYRSPQLDPATPYAQRPRQSNASGRTQERQQENQQPHGDTEDQKSAQPSHKPASANREDRDRGQERDRSTCTHGHEASPEQIAVSRSGLPHRALPHAAPYTHNRAYKGNAVRLDSDM